MSQGLFGVALYETLGPDAIEFILNHAEISCVVASLPHIPTLLKIAPRLRNLKLIVSMDGLDQGEQKGLTKHSVLADICAQHGIKLYDMAQVEKIGADSGRQMRPAEPEDIYTINYTSGTTGVPKGVVLTHACTLAGNCATRVGNPGTKDDVGLSYLPLAHVLERLVEHGGFSVGARFGFFRGDLDGLLDDIKLLKPTGFASVPRLFNRFNTAIRAGTIEADGFKGSLSRHIIDTKLASMKRTDGTATTKHWLYDRFWTPKVKSAIGFNRVNTLASGSAPLDPKVQEFLAAAFGVRFAQGYGMTESSGVATLQIVDDYSTGNVGPPSPCVELCLESLPELEYSVDDKPYPRGELLMRGPSIFSGYFKNDEENKKAIEPDGWFHTGDIAQFDELGRVKIIDRKKNILKLAQGEYVAPERLENVYAANCGLLANAFVHGDGDKSSLVGIIGVNPETFAPFASKILGQTITQEDVAMLGKAAGDIRVRRQFLRILDDIGVKNKFNGFERVRNIMLAVEPFTVENDLLTPT
jgi:long-chain acyl-CoA synthetase